MPGHWEGPSYRTSDRTHRDVVERHSRFTMLVKLPGRTRRLWWRARKHIRKLPEQLRRSLTWDQGKEMSATSASRLPPTCRFILIHGMAAQRQREHQRPAATVLPRRTVSRAPQTYLNSIASAQSQRPRKTLGFETLPIDCDWCHLAGWCTPPDIGAEIALSVGAISRHPLAWCRSDPVARYRYDFHSEIKTRERRKPWLPCVHQRIAHTNGCAYPTLFDQIRSVS